MKKVIVFLSIVILSLPFLFADTMSWKWRGNDEDVFPLRDANGF